MANKHMRAGSEKTQKLSISHSMCGSKASYDTKREAKKTVRTAYLCPFCQKWHGSSGHRGR